MACGVGRRGGPLSDSHAQHAAPGTDIASDATCGAPIPGPFVAGSLVVHAHRVELVFTDAHAPIQGRGTLRLSLRERTRNLLLDAEGLVVREVRWAGRALPFHQTEGRLEVVAPAVVEPSAEVVLDLRWTIPTDAPHINRHGAQIHAGYHTAAWMPTLADPAQRATLDLTLHTPSEWQAVASGRSVQGAARGEHRYIVDRPTPPFLFAFAAGRFAVAERTVGGVTLRAFGSDREGLERALDTTAPMLEFFTGRLGQPYPFETYTQVFVSGRAAQEAVGFALIGDSVIEGIATNPSDDWLFSHELAHQWFGVLVPCADFADFWLNEGFASFMVAAYKERRWGRGAYDAELAHLRRQSERVAETEGDAPLSLLPPGARLTRAITENDLQPRGITYARGAVFLHRIRELLGDAVFWRGVRLYLAQRAGRSARTEHLRLAFEEASGRDLRPYFRRWVYETALP